VENKMPNNNPNLHQWSRVGGMTRAAHHDPQILARSGQEGLLRRFEREVDPEGVLEPAELRKRALRARRAHMLGMAIDREIKRKRRIAAATANNA
jgi:hypothetical protein